MPLWTSKRTVLPSRTWCGARPARGGARRGRLMMCFGDNLRALDDEARRILSPDISQAIQRVTRVPELERALAETAEHDAQDDGNTAKGTEADK